MADFRAEIPTRAFINGMIIDRAERTDTFRSCVQDVLSNCCNAPTLGYQFKNPAYVAGLLYCLVVVPKEIWELPKDHEVYEDLKKTCLLNIFNISLRDPHFDSDPVYYLIHRLRNAVAHANFSIDESQAFTFWDRKTRADPPNWRASVSSGDLMMFLSQLGHLYDELRKAGDGTS